MEMLIGVIVPIVLYSMKSVRESANGLLLAASCVIVGTIMNRFNVNFFAQAGPNTSYFPSLVEILVTIGLVSLMILLYRLAVTLPAGIPRAGLIALSSPVHMETGPCPVSFFS